jgi:hypothetical protein
MNATDMQQRIEKARAYAEHAREEIQEALFLLAALEPLVRDQKIITPLGRTYAAHTLNLLQWTLFRTATINLCSGVLDKDERSGSIRVLIDMLEGADLVTAVCAERTRPLSSGRRPERIDPQLWAALEKEREERERTEAEAAFDDELPKVRAASKELCNGALAKRLWDARRKVLAHGNVVFEDGKYRGSLPEDFGLKWGDAEAFAAEAAALIERIFVTLYGHHLNLNESKEILAEYSEDFWRHLRAGIEAAPKELDGSVKEEPRV